MLRQNNTRPLKGLFAILLLLTLTVNNIRSQHKKDDFTRIFDGKTLNGWEGDSTIWSVENGNLTGEVTASTNLKAHTFLLWHGGQTNDFELKLEFRVTESGNSGINYRSELVQDVSYGMKGYQADIDGKHTYTGQIYEERGRGFLARRGEKSVLQFRVKPTLKGSLGDPDSLRQFIKVNDWNEFHIVARGNRMKHFINGILMSEVTDNDKTQQKFSGVLGLQVHAGPPMKAQFRNIRIKPLL